MSKVWPMLLLVIAADRSLFGTITKSKKACICSRQQLVRCWSFPSQTTPKSINRERWNLWTNMNKPKINNFSRSFHRQVFPATFLQLSFSKTPILKKSFWTICWIHCVNLKNFSVRNWPNYVNKIPNFYRQISTISRCLCPDVYSIGFSY